MDFAKYEIDFKDQASLWTNYFSVVTEVSLVYNLNDSFTYKGQWFNIHPYYQAITPSFVVTINVVRYYRVIINCILCAVDVVLFLNYFP